MKLDWDKIKCPKCHKKKFLGKYTDEPYCLNCGTKFKVRKGNMIIPDLGKGRHITDI